MAGEAFEETAIDETPRNGDNMMKRKLIAIMISGVMMFSLTGCTTEVIELTDTEEQIISEYAAHAVLQHFGKNQHNIVEELLVEEEIEEQLSDEEFFGDEPKEETPEDGIQVIVPDTMPEVTVSANSDMSIEEFFGIEDLEIRYKDYTVTKTYPEVSEEEFYVSIDATEGSNLLVLKFDVANLTGTDYETNMLRYGLKFKVGVNGASPRWVLSTMLMNDLTTYNEVIPANGTVELVLAMEIPEDTSVEQLSLMMKKGENSFTKDIK